MKRFARLGTVFKVALARFTTRDPDGSRSATTASADSVLLAAFLTTRLATFLTEPADIPDFILFWVGLMRQCNSDNRAKSESA
jgi:hypothetical protein